jgi:DNA/RNA-binding domain of Phe-tRNA-synthetase-like protein/ureidoglycolate hydrolase
MRPTVGTGDVALRARPAGAAAFGPFGRLLLPGDRTYVGRRGRILLAMDVKRAGPRRVTDLFRYPEAKRVLLPLADASMWFVALPPGEKPAGEAVAFLLPPGCGVVVGEGVWHAGPIPLADAPVCEMLEAVGTADRFDRRSVRELIGAEALRIQLPEEPAGSRRPFDLDAPGAVLFDAAIQGRLRVALGLLEDLDVPSASDGLRDELERTAAGLRSMWGHVDDAGAVPGIARARAVVEAAGFRAEDAPPRCEVLLAHVLSGKPVVGRDVLDEALALASLRTRLPAAVYDAAAIQGPVLVRAGLAGESLEGTGQSRRALEGRPVLCDEAGPLAAVTGAARRVRAGAGTRCALVALFLPPGSEAAAAEAALDGVSATIAAFCGGKAGARRLVG